MEDVLDLSNKITHGNGEKMKKKKKKKKEKESETADQHELHESPVGLTEKHHKHKKKNKIKELDSRLDAPRSKKKRKLYGGDGVVFSGEDDGVTNLDQDKTESPELQGSSGQTPSKTKKRRSDVTRTNCDAAAQEEQSLITTQHEEVMCDQESTSPDVLTGTGKRKKNPKFSNNTNSHQVKDKKAATAESQELQGSSGQKLSKKKKTKADATQTNCDAVAQEEQSVMTTQHEEAPNMKDQESGSTAELTGTQQFKKKKTLMDDPLVYSKLLNELKEFCPKIESKDQDAINKMMTYDLPRFQEFKKQGVLLKHGRFSDAELAKLRGNVSDFLALTGVKDATKLFHPKRFPEEKQQLTKLKRNYSFFKRIAEGIPRPCHDVFNRGRKLFDGRLHKGRFTDEEIKSLLKYHTLYGSNWQKISELTGRSASSLEKRFNNINAAKKSGPWSVKEEQRLLRAVKDHITTVLKTKYPNKRKTKRVRREMLYQQLPWFSIAQKVKTRCWSKCREKWMSILTMRMSSGTACKGRKAQEAKIRLIKAMYELQVEDIADVDWENLTSVFGDVPPAYVQAKWHQLKVSYVPEWKTKCFGDIVDFLYEKILPSLVKDCEDLDDELKPDQKHKFLISDIFRDINEDNCSDSDEETGQKKDAKSTQTVVTKDESDLTC